uniref:Major facilitator superfamily (MFS) profile domain-containing protein n=1 Tax=Leersia perrieri TaxID=77586 RepID=A0A0D9XWL8_9ORYZ
MAAGDEVAAAASPSLDMAYHESCPGCAVDRAKALNPGVPYLRFFHIWIIILVSCLPISSLFPFLYFMIRDLHIAKRVEDIGFYAGFVGASYMLGRALTSTAWGMVADRFGRKPICIQYFVWSEYTLLDGDNYTISYRFIEWLTWTKKSTAIKLSKFMFAYAIEVCRPEHQAIGLSLVSTSWAIGLIIGPAIANRKISKSISCEFFIRKETLHKHAIEKKGCCASESLSTRLVDLEEVDEQRITSSTNKNLFKNWPLMSSIVLFCIVSFDDMAYTEIFSLWSESDKKFGGLNFSSEDVGQVLAITGASILLYQTFIYPQAVKVLGIINTSRVAIILSMALLISYPPMTYLSRPWLSIVVNIASVLKNNFVVTIVTCSFILQNNSVVASASTSNCKWLSHHFNVLLQGICSGRSWHCANFRGHKNANMIYSFQGRQREVVESAAAAPLLEKKDITTGDGYCIEGCPGCAEERRRQAAAPLLEKKGTTGAGDGYNCIEGCPGCAVDRRKAANAGIPYGSFLFVWIDSGAETPLLKGEGEFHPGCPGCVHDRKKGLYRGLPYKEFLYLWMICLTAESHKKSLFKNWPLMSSILTYCVFSLHDTAYSEIFSLWTVSDRKYGGLSSSSKDVGQVLAVAGASLLVYQLFIYRWVDKILGPINSTRIASALSIPIIAAYPFMTHLSGIRLGVDLYTAAMIKSVLAPQGQRGAANGIATTAMSLFKAVAPAGADSLGHKRDNMQRSFQLMGEEAPPSPPAMRPVFHDGCPGCAIERKLESSQGIPYKEFIFVGITTIASSLPISSLFPFLYFMIEDLHVAKKEQDIGLYAGFLGNRIGRKPIIKFSILSVVIFNTLFGLSVRYWMAIATRFLLGALNGMLAPIKAYSIEVCRPEHQALGLSIVSTGWGIGLVLGPAIGGYFAQPAKQYPKMFSEKSIFARFPYFLPCLCISLIALVVLISCIWLPETLHKHKNIEGEIEMIDNSRSTMEDSHKQKSLYKNWPLMSSIIAYCVFTLHDTAYSEALSIPILAVYPFMPHLSGFRLWIALYLGTILKGVLSSQSQRGAANGISTTAMSFFKAIAPAGAGALFSWAQKRQNAAFFPGDQMIFFILNVIELVGLVLTFKPFLAIPK